MVNFRRIVFVFIVFIGILLCFGCNPKTRYDILNFVFDGVPDTVNADSLALQDSLSLLANNTKDAVSFNIPTTKTFFHPPYQARECEVCHNTGSFGDLNEDPPALCYNCHESFNDKYNFVHGPVDAGFCTTCHNPHNAKYEKLLTRTGQDICFKCHDKKLVLKNEVHDGIEETFCTECHNPHGGEDRYIFN